MLLLYNKNIRGENVSMENVMKYWSAKIIVSITLYSLSIKKWVTLVCPNYVNLSRYTHMIYCRYMLEDIHTLLSYQCGNEGALNILYSRQTCVQTRKRVDSYFKDVTHEIYCWSSSGSIHVWFIFKYLYTNAENIRKQRTKPLFQYNNNVVSRTG